MTIAEQLNQLAKIAPKVCRRVKLVSDSVATCYLIGDYEFQFDNDVILASLGAVAVGGRPALAWLRDALEGVIEARGYRWVIKYISDHESIAEVKYVEIGYYALKTANNPAEALLAALIKAWGGGEG